MPRQSNLMKVKKSSFIYNNNNYYYYDRIYNNISNARFDRIIYLRISLG